MGQISFRNESSIVALKIAICSYAFGDLIITKMNARNQWLVKAVTSTCTAILRNCSRNSIEERGLAILRLLGRLPVSPGKPKTSAGRIPPDDDFVGCASSTSTEITLETIQLKTSMRGSSLNHVYSRKGMTELGKHVCQDIFKSIPEKSGHK